MQRDAIQLGRVDDAILVSIQKDMGGYGSAVFSTNFIAAVKDVGIAKPTSVVSILVCYNRWYTIMKEKFKGSTSKSYTDPDARKLLVAPSILLARSVKTDFPNKERSYASITDIQDRVDPQVEKACSWVHQLGPAFDGSDGLNAEKLIKDFGILLYKTTQAWSEIADLKKQGKDTIQNEKDAIKIESNLMIVSHLIYKVDTYEKRRLPTMEPDFLTKALEDLSVPWRNQFHHICRRGEVITRPVVWMFAPLFEVVHPQKNQAAVLTLLALLELFAIELGDDESNFLTAILFTVRCAVLDWKMSEIDPDAIVAELMKLYEKDTF
jgi:hypothetical protein